MVAGCPPTRKAGVTFSRSRGKTPTPALASKVSCPSPRRLYRSSKQRSPPRRLRRISRRLSPSESSTCSGFEISDACPEALTKVDDHGGGWGEDGARPCWGKEAADYEDEVEEIQDDEDITQVDAWVPGATTRPVGSTCPACTFINEDDGAGR